MTLTRKLAALTLLGHMRSPMLNLARSLAWLAQTFGGRHA